MTTQSARKRVPNDAQSLTNRQARIWIRFGVRVVVVAILSALLVQRVPFLAANRAIVDALSGIVVLWPLWTQLGRVYAERIVRGRERCEAKQWDAAQKLLAPFAAPPVSRLFDTSGEGTYLLACALNAQGDWKKAAALHAQNVRLTPWGKKSQEWLHENPMESKPAVL